MKRKRVIAASVFVLLWTLVVVCHGWSWGRVDWGDAPGVVKGLNGFFEFGCLPMRFVGARVTGVDPSYSTQQMVWCAGLSIGLWAGGCWLVGSRAARIIARVRGRRTWAEVKPMDHGRREALRAGFAGAAALASAGPVAASALVIPNDLKLRRYRVPIAGLPTGLDGLRIVQISDTHCGPHVATSLIEESVEQALALDADLYVLTGDYVSVGPQYVEPGARVFEALVRRKKTALPVMGVLGNHDWWEGGDEIGRVLSEIGVRMIDNDRVFLTGDRVVVDDEPGGSGRLCIAAVGDLIVKDVDVARAFRGVRGEGPSLLLSHEPDVAEMPELAGESAPRVDLMLCGHTHGGQVSLPIVGALIVPSAYGQKYAGGIVRGPRFPVIVSRGIGTSGLAVRWGVPPEIVEITLKRPAGVRQSPTSDAPRTTRPPS